MWRLLVLISLSAAMYAFPAAATQYDVLYVKPDGDDTKSCGSVTNACKTISQAVENAEVYSSNHIKVAQGEYTDVISVVNSLPQLAIEGGWNSSFTSQSYDPALTRVIPSNNDAVVNISPGIWDSVDIRLAYLSFRGTTDLQRTGFNVSANANTIVLSLEQCLIDSFRGRAVYIYANSGAKVTISLDKTTIENNYQPADNPWGGAGLDVSSYGNSVIVITLSKCRIRENQASSGGAVYLYADGASLQATFENSILTGNEATYGGAMTVVAAIGGDLLLKLTNTTLADNQAVAFADGIYFFTNDGEIEAFLKNTIAWEDGTDIYIQKQGASSSLQVNADFSIIGEVENQGGEYTPNSSTYNMDPLLDPSYHLTELSPAKDNGICGLEILNYSRIAPYDDIDGDPRPGWGNKKGCDIGADEYTYTFPWALFHPAFIRPQ